LSWQVFWVFMDLLLPSFLILKVKLLGNFDIFLFYKKNIFFSNNLVSSDSSYGKNALGLGYKHLAAGLCCGLSSLAAGLAIGIVGGIFKKIIN
jgi:hypothetical protein